MTLTLGLGYLVGTAIFGAALLVVLSAQIRAMRFHAFLYWAVITATKLAGTTLADFLDRSLGIGYLGAKALTQAGLEFQWTTTQNLSTQPPVSLLIRPAG